MNLNLASIMGLRAPDRIGRFLSFGILGILFIIALLFHHIIPPWPKSRMILGAQQFSSLEEQGGTQYYLVRTQQELAAALERHDDNKVIFADGETGPGVQFGSGPAMPATMSLGAANDPDLTRRFARWAGQGFRLLNIDVVLTPQADLFLPSSPSVLGWRSFGSDPELVTSHVKAYVQGLNEGGVFPIVKHYPGHGMTPYDTHDHIGVTSATQKQQAGHLLPFRELSGNDIPFGIMVGHLALEDPHVFEMPAATSSHWMDLLRKEFAFDGITITDSANMNPVKNIAGGEPRFTVEALRQGVDLILEPIQPKTSYNAVRAALSGKTMPEPVVEKSDARLEELLKEVKILREVPLPAKEAWLAEGAKLGSEILNKGAIAFGGGERVSTTTLYCIVGESEMPAEALALITPAVSKSAAKTLQKFNPTQIPTTTPICLIYWDGGTGPGMDKPWTEDQWNWLIKARDANTPVSVVVHGNPVAGYMLRNYSNVRGIVVWGRSNLSCKAAADWLSGNLIAMGEWPIE